MKTIIRLLILCVFFAICSCGSSPKDEPLFYEAIETNECIDDTLILSEAIGCQPVVGGVEDQLENEIQYERSIADSEIIAPPKEEGNLVYYCPPKMLENTCNNVSVCISISEVKKAAESLAQRVSESSGGDPLKITKDISDISIEIYPKMKVELKYDEKDFEVIHEPNNLDLTFDGTSDLNWDWIIKPLNVGGKQLTLVVSGYDKVNKQWVYVDVPPKVININVMVDPRSYLSKLWSFLTNNPEWLFIQIFFPIIGFYVGRRRKKK